MWLAKVKQKSEGKIETMPSAKKDTEVNESVNPQKEKKPAEERYDPRRWLDDEDIVEPARPKRPKTEAGREKQMVALAVELAEKQLREGTASAQVITHYLKLGTEKEKLEREIMREQKELISEKTKALRAMKQMEELYSEAIEAMKRYSGNGDEV